MNFSPLTGETFITFFNLNLKTLPGNVSFKNFKYY